MRFRIFFFFAFLLSSSVSEALIFEDDESLIKAQKAGNNLKNDIPVGKIIVKHEDKIIDYCSAVVFGKPAEKVTKTILSSAHIFTDTKLRYPKLRFYFQDSCESLLPIEEIRPFSNKPTNANEDLAMFYLHDPIPCNPLVRLAHTAQKETLTCLSYGLALTTGGEYKIHNTFASQVYSVSNIYFAPRDNYFSLLKADRFVDISIKNGSHRSVFIAEPQSQPQFFPHDSGSPWFTGNKIDGYTLHALTQSTTPAPSDVIGGTKITLGHIDFTRLGQAPMTLDIYQLPKLSDYHNCLTTLAPNRNWIYENLRGQ